MSKPAITKDAQVRLSNIHRLSQRYNQRVRKDHHQRLLELMRKHIDEIEELSRKKDKHFLTETGDLIILCFELLLEHGRSMDATLYKCFKRYEKKLPGLINELKDSR